MIKVWQTLQKLRYSSLQLRQSTLRCTTLFALVISIFATACSSSFHIPAQPPGPIVIQIQGNNNIVSAMPLDTTTVSKVTDTQIADGEAALRLDLTNKGAKALYSITSTNIGKQLQVYWQDNIISTQTIESPQGGSIMTFVIRLPDSTPSDIQNMIVSISTGGKDQI